MSDPEPKPASSPLKELSGRIGKYEIEKPLGKGAMGMVYLAHDTILERDVALKVMVSQIADDPELNQRFIREAKAVAKMTHPNVVQVYDLGHHTDGSPYIAMELLKGQDLQKAMRTPPAMSTERKVSVIVQVLAGLAHAHQAGIVHRDIKPANVFINQDGSVKIMDFGVARLTTASMTGTGNIVGTADYMSPEQVKGAKVDGRSDLFSVGCMLFELLAGRRPFHSDNLMAIFYKITHEEPNFDLIPAGAEYDALMPVLKKALAKNLDDRHQTAYDFAIELREVLKQFGGSATADRGLESLLDMDAGPPPPPMDTDGGLGPTLMTADQPRGGTLDLGPTRSGAPTAGRQPATVAGTRSSAPTVVGPETVRPPTAARLPRPAPAPTPAPMLPRYVPPPPAQSSPVLYVVLGAMGVALLAAGGFIWMNQQKPPKVDPSPPGNSLEVAPSTTLATPPPPSTTLAPVPSLAPPPTFGQTAGRGAAFMKNASSAFAQGDYDRAINQAQAALREDSNNLNAKRLIDDALNGQRAEARFAAAEDAIRRGDFEKAQAEVNAGRAAAPWDQRSTDLTNRIRQAQQQADQRAQQQRAQQLAGQVNNYINQADTALGDRKYDGAIALYDEALKLDATNQRALNGRSAAIQARATAQAQASQGTTQPAGGVKRFVSGRTTASSAETKNTGPEGFDVTPDVKVQRGSVAAELPGKIVFDVSPDFVKPGDRYTVKIFLQNEGSAPIALKDMFVSTTINGKKGGAPVPPNAQAVAPGQRALLWSVPPDVWKEDTATWSMEVSVRTSLGERYANTVTWK
jgi:serine/threonine protein kinase